MLRGLSIFPRARLEMLKYCYGQIALNCIRMVEFIRLRKAYLWKVEIITAGDEINIFCL